MSSENRYPRVVVQPDVKVNRGKWAYFPSICCLANGDILVAYHERQHGYDPVAGRNMLCISRDNGKTWAPQVVVMDLPDHDTRDPYIMQTPDGAVYVSREGYAVTSKDSGKTWKVTIEGLSKNEWNGPGMIYPNYAVAQLSNGEIIWTGCCMDYMRVPGEAQTSVRATSHSRFANGGIQWEHRPHPELTTSPDEWTLVETDVPGRLVCMMRVQHVSEYYMTSHSDDYGHTWAPAELSAVWCSQAPSRPMLTKLRDGTIVLVYAERKNSRVLAVPSFDNGRTWALDRKLVVLDDPDRCWGDFAYPDACQISDGRLLCVYYTDGRIYGTFLDPDDFRRRSHPRATAARAPTASTIARWQMDEGEGDIAHDGAGSNYGKIFGAKRTQGPLGGALQFDGARDHVMVLDTDTLRVPRTFTIEARVRIDSTQGDMAIVSKVPAYYFGITDGKLDFRNGPTRTVGEKELTPGKWHHVAVRMLHVREYLRTEFYIDGEVDAGHTEADVLYNNSTYLGTLGDAGTWADYWRAAGTPDRGDPVSAFRAQTPPSIGDGDREWDRLDWYTGFTLLGPGHVAAQQTAFKVLYDDANIYVRIRAEQERIAEVPEHPPLPDDLTGVWREDLIDLFFAPPERKDDSCQIAVNVNGSTYERESGLGRAHLEWQSNARRAIRRGDDHWQLDMAVPLAGFIDRPVAEGEQWSFHVGRHERPGGQVSGYAPARRTRMLTEVTPEHLLRFAGSAPPLQQRTCTGTVRNTYDRPVVGAMVAVADRRTYTDAQGSFSLSLPTIHVPDVCVIARGYYGHVFRPTPAASPASIVLIPQTPALAVHAAAAYSDQPITSGPNFRASGLNRKKQSENALFIGIMSDRRSNPFKGALCGVALHNTPLRATEIRQLAPLSAPEDP